MQSLHETRPQHRFGVWVFRLLYITLMVVGIVTYIVYHNQVVEWDTKNAALAKQPVIVGKVTIGDTTVVIPTRDFFIPGEMWSLASKTHPLDSTFTVKDLSPSPVATGGGEKLQVSKRIVPQLKALVAAAKADGQDLMLSSAYRSIAEQQTTFDTFTARYGEEMARDYVAAPGTSEHHTGLAVDFSDTSDACIQDSEKCSLSMESAAWLKTHAPQYGFVLRYPDGKKSITGVGYEWWHFRYVGVALAKAVSTNDLTLDEVIEKLEKSN